MLETGCYALDQAENGALLVYLYLLQNNRKSDADALLKVCPPSFSHFTVYFVSISLFTAFI